MNTRNGRVAGFTLLELLIAMSLLGFILALLFAGMRLGARSWDAGEARVEKSAHLSALQVFLRRELSQAIPYKWKKKPDMNLAFIGQPGFIRMVAPLSVRSGPGGLFQIGLDLARNEEGPGQLVMRTAMPDVNSVDFNPLALAEPIVLAEQVEELSFAYFGADSKDSPPYWQEQWGIRDTQQRLPLLIRLRLRFSDGRPFPDLVVAPLIGMDTGCMWDNLANRCVSE